MLPFPQSALERWRGRRRRGNVSLCGGDRQCTKQSVRMGSFSLRGCRTRGQHVPALLHAAASDEGRGAELHFAGDGGCGDGASWAAASASQVPPTLGARLSGHVSNIVRQRTSHEPCIRRHEDGASEATQQCSLVQVQRVRISVLPSAPCSWCCRRSMQSQQVQHQVQQQQPQRQEPAQPGGDGRISAARALGLGVGPGVRAAPALQTILIGQFSSG